MKVFISYSTADRSFSESLATALRDHGLSVWYDQWEIKVGDSIVGKITEGISAADALVVVLSSTSIRSKWVLEELNAATMRLMADSNVMLLPVLREQCDIPSLLRHRRYADFTERFEHGLVDLLEALLPLNRLWTNLADLQARHTAVIQSVASASDNDDVAEQIMLLYSLMSAAIDVRVEIEGRQDLAISMASSANLFDKIALLAERGVDLRSQTWNGLVYLRSEMAHSVSGHYFNARALADYLVRHKTDFQARYSLHEALGRLSELMTKVASRRRLDSEWQRDDVV